MSEFQAPKHIEAKIESEPRASRIFIVIFFEGGTWMTFTPCCFLAGQRIGNYDKEAVWNSFLDQRRKYSQGRMPETYRLVSIEVPVVHPTMIVEPATSA